MKVKLIFIITLFIVSFIFMKCTNPSNTDNNPPIISSITVAPDSIGVNDSSTVTCTASDPDGDELTYLWSTDTGSINGSGSSVIWISSDSSGIFIIYCQVNDGNGSSDIDSVSIEVAETENPIIGEWKATTPLSFARAAHSCAVYNGFLYIIGGTDGSTQYDLNDVQFSTINIDGTLNSWQTTTFLPAGRSNHTNFIHSGRLYLIGGWDPVVRYSNINGDGTLSAWDSTLSLPEGRLAHSTIVNSNYVYVLGGYIDSVNTGLNDVFFGEINPDGTLNNWQTTTSFQFERFDHSTNIYNGIIYIIGGENRSTIFDDVQYAQINPDGTIGQWQNTTSLPAAKTAHTSFVHDNHLFVCGGSSDNIIYTKINPDGTLGQWQLCSSSFSIARGNHTSIVYNNILYIIGGSDGQNLFNDVQFAQLYDIE